jgi:putative transposase
MSVRRTQGGSASSHLHPAVRDELFNGEIFYTLAEAQIVIEAWRRHYNTVRLHSSFGHLPQVTMPPWLPSGSTNLHPGPATAQEAILH